ncbi:hypothetical protein F2Q69_00052734 [Brassica cretica]|uniref:Uncharacterized protein n=1 Tax=Brassica cretica TaxID=69181 RepID=A0A8S9N2R1_BRACR|nr:hypothetical protein F2Q69_00052734 [Brassica cretica]
MKRLLQLPSSRSLPPGFGFLPLDPGSLPPGPGSCHWVMGPFPQVWVLPPVTGPCPRVWDLPPSSRPSDFLCLKINGNLPFIRLIPAITTMKMKSYALCSTPTTPHTGPGHDLQLTDRDTPCSSKHIEAPCSLQNIDYSTICSDHVPPRTDARLQLHILAQATISSSPTGTLHAHQSISKLHAPCSISTTPPSVPAIRPLEQIVPITYGATCS